ncbi:hypothetical protein G5C51_13915 [Streptomyces sp. A7024]|uniref:Uncharacterized protein n=2 Tax=Streptomyces coryli TaxID=1128680 RepID=A0A6G4U0T3_9ACTN|nr:hypothetical protein [Streptomyces coryli]NGN64988.1 hypothetical protein [Streptomyces coryli]
MLAAVPGELVLVICLVSGASIPAPVQRAVEALTLALFAAAATVLAADHRRHRAAGLPPREALLAAVRDTAPATVRRLTVHELKLFTSFCRWITRRPPHGVGPGDAAVTYAAGQSFVIWGFLFVSVIETVALALIIPWPVVHLTFLVIDIWGIYFIIALHASCAVRPHVIAADGSLHLRYGVLLGLRIPADRIARVRTDRCFPDGGGPALVRDDGSLDLAVSSQTTVTVELTEGEPLRFVRPLGKVAAIQGPVRFYADDPASAVAGTKRTADSPGSASVSRTRSR